MIVQLNQMWGQFLKPIRLIKQINLIGFLFFLLISQLAFAEVTQGFISDVDKTVEVSPVMIDGEVLFMVRGASSLPSVKRAKDIAVRIVDVAKDSRFSLEDLKIVSNEAYTSIYAGDVRLLNIYDADSRVEGLERSALADAHVESIRNAIQNYRTQRSPGYLIESGIKILIATIIIIFIVIGLKSLSRKSIYYSILFAKHRLIAFESSTYSMLRAQQLINLVKTTIRVIFWIIILIALNTYMTYLLILLPWVRPHALHLIEMVLTPLYNLTDSFISSLPGLVFIFILIIGLRYILRILNILFIDVANGKVSWNDFEPEWAHSTYKLVRVFIIAIGLVVAYPYIPGSSSEAFKGLSILFGVLVSFGSSSVISNIVAGYSLIYRRAFKIGDWIKVGEHFGEVIKISSMVSNLRTPKNEIVVIPNSELLNTTLINYSTKIKGKNLTLHTTVGIGYETPWRQVDAMLKIAADKTEGLLKNPKPYVWQKSLGDFCVVYEINAFTDTPELMQNIYNVLHQNIQDVFNEYGVQIMTPNYRADTEKPKIVSKEDWYLSPANAVGEKESK